MQEKVKWGLIGFVLGIVFLGVGITLATSIFGRPDAPPRFTEAEYEQLEKENVTLAEKVESLTFELAGERDAKTALERSVVEKTTMIARLEATVRTRPVKIIPGAAPPPEVIEVDVPVRIPCPEGDSVLCPACPPPYSPESVEMGGGCTMQLIEVDGRDAATADWWAEVIDPEAGWSAKRGPERVEDVVYLKAPPAADFRSYGAWGLSAGLMAPSERILDPVKMVGVSYRRQFAPKWSAQLQVLVPRGSVTTFSSGSYRGVGGVVTLERRFR